jgi:hypothetical protein
MVACGGAIVGPAAHEKGAVASTRADALSWPRTAHMAAIPGAIAVTNPAPFTVAIPGAALRQAIPRASPTTERSTVWPMYSRTLSAESVTDTRGDAGSVLHAAVTTATTIANQRMPG